MKMILLAAGAAAIALSAGPTLAAHKGKMASIGEPKQPIAYSQLNAYLKASPKQRMSKDWSTPSGAMATAGADTAANASATTTASPSLPGDTSATTSSSATSTTAAPLPTTPPVETPSAGAAAPSPTTAPGAAPATTPPK